MQLFGCMNTVCVSQIQHKFYSANALQSEMQDKIPKLLNYLNTTLKIPMHLNFPMSPFDLCLCHGLVKELMIWASLPDGQSQKTSLTFAIVLWYTEWCHKFYFAACFRVLSVTVKFSHHIQPISSICTNVLFVMPFKNAALSLLPNFLHVRFQQSIMQDFKSSLQHSF